jgi:hypothetical protein
MTKKFYLTRTQTRAMAADHPIGDPTGGAAYGEKNDPITAIISIASMAGTYAAAGSFAAMTLMQGITFAGAALSLVGNVTGNKTLMKIGAIAGIAGGLGMAYDSVMGTTIGGTVGDAFGMEKTAADAALSQTPTAAPPPEVVPDAAGGGADVTKAASYPTAAQANPVPVPDVNSGSNLTPINTAPNLSSPAVNPLDPGTDILGNKIPGMSYAQGVKPPTSYGSYKPGFAESMKAGNYLDAASAAGSNAMAMLKDNPTGAYVAAQAIGGVSDWLSGKTDAEIAALKANTGFADAKAQEVQLAIAKEEKRRLNMANRYASVSPQSNIAVNPNADARTPGLVAANMQTRPA